MYWVELVKGKDQPKAVGQILHMSKNLWNTGKIVTMDSGFSVAKGILAMREKGVFDQSLVKPRGRGWLVFIPGKYFDEYFVNK